MISVAQHTAVSDSSASSTDHGSSSSIMTQSTAQSVTISRWCSLSPDLNPIKHLWKELKHVVWRRPPSNLRQLNSLSVGPTTCWQVQNSHQERQKSLDLNCLPLKVVQQDIGLRVPSFLPRAFKIFCGIKIKSKVR